MPEKQASYLFLHLTSFFASYLFFLHLTSFFCILPLFISILFLYFLPEFRLPSFAARIAPREYAVLFAALKRTIIYGF